MAPTSIAKAQIFIRWFQKPPDFRIQNADRLPACGSLDSQKLLGGKRKGMFLALRRGIIEAVEIADSLHIRLVFDQLFRAPVQQTDMWIGAFDNLAVHFEDQAQHAVRRRVLRAEVDIVILDLRFGHYFASSSVASSAFSSPGSMRCTPSHGLRKSKERYSWVSFTGS